MTSWKMRPNAIGNVVNDWKVIVTAKDGTEHTYKHSGDLVTAGKIAVKNALADNIQIKTFRVERSK